MERKTALVTGAGKGIGRAVALELAKSGMNVVVHYNASKENAEETSRLCREEGVESFCLQADISQEKQCEHLVKSAVEQAGGLHVLVNNAGITKDGLFIRMREKDFDDVINANLKGAFFVSKYASSFMLKQRYGRIVNISSISGVSGNAGQANYSASKAGLIGLTKTLAKELGKKGILVNAVAPGFVETDMTASLPDKVRDFILQNTAVGYMARPEDIAFAVKFLAAEENRYITGQVLCVDGGISM